MNPKRGRQNFRFQFGCAAPGCSFKSKPCMTMAAADAQVLDHMERCEVVADYARRVKGRRQTGKTWRPAEQLDLLGEEHKP